MIDYPSELKESISPDLVVEQLRADYPWISQWSIHVSIRLINVVGDFFAEIEAIIGTHSPPFSFFRISEEVDNDFDSTYQRKLQIFFQTRRRIDARDKALIFAMNRAIGQSLTVCYACGNRLEYKNLKDEGERELFPFLPKPKAEKTCFSVNNVMRHICMSCALLDWQEKQKFIVENAVVADVNAEVNPFDILDIGEDEQKKDMDAVEVEDTSVDTTDNDLLAEIDESKLAPTITMYDIAVVRSLEESSKEMARDHAHRIKGIINRIKKVSPEKRLVSIPEQWRKYCQDLAWKFPNFLEVVNFLRYQMALSFKGDKVLRLPPFLLVGDPGIGKTEFLLTLTSGLGTTLVIIDISAAQTGVALTGSEAYWGNTRTGELFDTLAFGEIANPILMLDEIDKGRSGDYKPLVALHQLLEPRQARVFKDLSLTELVLDASHVMWIATANTVDNLEKQIIDRFTIFNIPTPSNEQMYAIATNQYQRFICTHASGQVFEKTLRPEVMAELCQHHPRKVRKILEQSFGLAAYDDRNYIAVEDIRASDTGDKEDRQAGIGFLCSIN